MKVNIFSVFGRPSLVYINGLPVREESVDNAVRYFEIHIKTLKSYKVTRINGKVAVEFFTRTKEEKTKFYQNEFGVNIQGYCARHDCQECLYFFNAKDGIYLGCPLREKREIARAEDYAEAFTAITTKNNRRRK